MARRTRTLLTQALSAAGVAFVITALLPAVSSQAAQPKTVAEAQAQLDSLSDQAEVASEQYNGAKLLLSQAQQKAAAATVTAGRAHDLVVTEQAQVGVFAVQSYESGGLSEGLAIVLNTKSPAQAMDRIAMLQHLSGQQSTALAAVRSADLRYQQSLSSAAQAKARATALAAQLAQKQAQIKAAVDKSALVLAQLTAAQRAQLLAAQKAKAAADQARAAAALASITRAQAARAASVRAAALAASRRLVRPAPAKDAPASVPVVAQSLGGSSVAQRAVAAALSKLGDRYVFGASGPSTFDCSGLVQWAYGRAGVSTAHYTGAFWNSYRHVSYDELKPGDLVFFHRDHHHVGIYIGNGMMVNAPHTGDVVRIASVLGHGAYSGAVRVVG
ncbi:MAG: peptidoglycan DL-endopeptidase CwlO [Actinomycetota bacterium]|nr:peptidoglycan DL-endopeptidase CwlO [Actinomycetota bacterium]